MDANIVSVAIAFGGMSIVCGASIVISVGIQSGYRWVKANTRALHDTKNHQIELLRQQDLIKKLENKLKELESAHDILNHRFHKDYLNDRQALYEAITMDF